MKEENKTLVKPHEAYYEIQTSMPILLIIIYSIHLWH